MVTIRKGEMVEGRPLFVDDRPKAAQGSFFAENSRLFKLAPSNCCNALFSRIERLWRSFVQFFTINRTALFENRSLRMCTKLEGQQPLFLELVDHFGSFLATDKAVSNRFKAAVGIAQKERKELRSIGWKWSELIPAAHDAFIAKKKDELTKLKVGESRLFALSGYFGADFESSLYAVMTKKESGFSVRIVGKGSAMGQLEHLGQALEVGGREKVRRELVYDNVPQDVILNDAWLKAIYQLPESPSAVLEKGLDALTPYKAALKEESELTTKSEKVQKLFWSVARAFSEGKERTDKRVKLRSHLMNLFELFRIHRYDLSSNSNALIAVRTLFTSVSADVLKAYKKGDISEPDLAAIRTELDLIAKSLQEVDQTDSRPFDGKIGSTRHQFFGVDLSKLKGAVPQFSKDAKKEELPALTGSRAPLPYLPLHLDTMKQQRHDWKMRLSKRELDSTIESHSIETPEDRRKFMQLFLDTPMELFERGPRHEVQKTKSVWWDFDEDGRTSAMDKINRFTEKFVADPKNAFYDQRSFDALLKMSYLVAVWERDSLGLTGYEWNHIVRLINAHYGDEWGGTRGGRNLNSTVPARFAAYVDAFSLPTLKDLSGVHLAGAYYFENDNKVKARPHLEKQYQLLCKLAGLSHQDEPDFKDFSSFDTLQRMLKPIHDPALLALYRQMATAIHYRGLKVKPGTARLVEEEEDEEKVGAKLGWMTPEAVQTDPEGLFAHFLGEMDEVNIHFAKEKRQQKLHFSRKVDRFSVEDKRKLLHLLKKTDVQVEAFQLMMTSPHFLTDPDTRNFLDALFFILDFLIF